MTDLAQLTAKEQVALVRRGKASPVEVVRATLDRIASLNPKLNAFITVLEDQALEAARELERSRAAGATLGPLAGVPVVVKDNVDIAGIRTTAGSRALENHYPDQDATVIRRLHTSGAIIVGKTQLNEFACAPNVFGDMPNPWDVRRLAGASSGGSAAAVAASICPVALGTDTGGSVRMPAAFSGIFGLKPTYGLVSLHGVVPLTWTLDHVGPLTRSVEDAAIVLAAIAGHDPLDPWSASVPGVDYPRALRRGVRGLRIGVPKEWFFDLVDPEIEAAVRRAIHLLQTLGMPVQEVSLPLMADCLDSHGTIHQSEAATALAPYVDQAADKCGDMVLRLVKDGRAISATDYVEAMRRRRELRMQLQAAFETVDVLIVPTTPMPPPLLEEFRSFRDHYIVNGEPVSLKYAFAGFNDPFNLTGSPALSAPCGFTADGLPIGMQIVGRRFDEATVLRVALAYQRHTDFHTRKPPV